MQGPSKLQVGVCDIDINVICSCSNIKLSFEPILINGWRWNSILFFHFSWTYKKQHPLRMTPVPGLNPTHTVLLPPNTWVHQFMYEWSDSFEPPTAPAITSKNFPASHESPLIQFTWKLCVEWNSWMSFASTYPHTFPQTLYLFNRRQHILTA